MASDAAALPGRETDTPFSLPYAAAAILPTVALLLGYFMNPVATLRSYLWAYLYVLSIPLGGLAILMLQHLTGGGWGVLLRRPLEAAIGTLPLLAVLFLPIAFGAPQLYPWAADDAELPYPKSLYLNLRGFGIRAIIYFAIWCVLAWRFNRWSAQQDSANPPGLDRRFRLLSGPGLGIMGLTVTFASMDWAMSLEPQWFSSLYGVLMGIGMVLSAFTFAICVVLSLADRPPYRAVLVSGHLRDLGSLTLAFVMVWAYLAISQFLLMWMGNLKEEAPYYVARSHHGWQYVIGVVVVVMFLLPFINLLSRDGKRNPRTLCFVATMILATRWLDLLWMVAPGRPIGGHTVFWTDLVAPPALFGIWLMCFRWQLQRRPLLPLLVDASTEGDHHG